MIFVLNKGHDFAGRAYLRHRLLTLSILSPLLLAGCSAGPSSRQPEMKPAQFSAEVKEGPTLPQAVAGHVGGIVQGLPVIAGGTSWSKDRTAKTWHRECYVYRGGKWSAGPTLPEPIADAAYAFDPDGLYLAGGDDGGAANSQVLHLSDPSSTGKWVALTPLPEAVEAATGAILDDTFYIFGGFSDIKSSNQLWSLDLRNPGATWRMRPSLPSAGRGYAAMVAAANRLYLFGGYTAPPYDRSVRIFDDVYSFDPASNQWTRINLTLPGYGWTATVIGPKQIMLTGRVAMIGRITNEIDLIHLSPPDAQVIGHLVIQACCMPAIPTGRQTWWALGGEPDAHRTRTKHTSVIKLAAGTP